MWYRYVYKLILSLKQIDTIVMVEHYTKKLKFENIKNDWEYDEKWCQQLYTWAGVSLPEGK